MKLTDEFEKCPGIYIFTNLINGKVYVGETIDMNDRMKKHNWGKRQLIHSAIKKYGIENFDIYVEYFPDFSKTDRLDLEEQLIIKFNCLAPNGYNILSRGQDSTGYKHSDATKSKMSELRKGRAPSEKCRLGAIKANTKKKVSEETRFKISQGNLGKTKGNSGFKGKHSEETKRKMSEVKKGKMTHENSMNALAKASKSNMVPVVQIDPNTLKIIKVWPSIADAAQHLKSRDRVTNIVACLKGKHKSAFGFKWEYLNV